MTRLEALRGLYDAVKDGHMPTFPVSFAALGEAAHMADEALDRKSVDAALALFADKLPGWWCELRISTRPRAVIGYTGAMHDEQADNPATALLLACIAALVAIEEEKA
jgi:hypothetical protein